jgi:hypothetical protein
MREYDVYYMDDNNGVVKRYNYIARDDTAALEKAREFCNEHEVEIWERVRYIGRLRKDGTLAVPVHR